MDPCLILDYYDLFVLSASRRFIFSNSSSGTNKGLITQVINQFCFSVSCKTSLQVKLITVDFNVKRGQRLLFDGLCSKSWVSFISLYMIIKNYGVKPRSYHNT